MKQATTHLDSVVRAVRLCFHRLASFADELHADLGINVQMRALLEFLVENGPSGSEQIAAAKDVPTHHVQRVVDLLLYERLVDLRLDVDGERAIEVVANQAGRDLFVKIRMHEDQLLKHFATHFPASDLETTFRTLSSLNQELEACASAARGRLSAKRS